MVGSVPEPQFCPVGVPLTSYVTDGEYAAIMFKGGEGRRLTDRLACIPRQRRECRKSIFD